MKNPLSCPACGCRGPHPVTHTHHRDFTFRGRPVSYTRRRKVCRNCGLPFWTKEIDEDLLDEVMKPDPPEAQEPPPGPPDIPEDLLG